MSNALWIAVNSARWLVCLVPFSASEIFLYRHVSFRRFDLDGAPRARQSIVYKGISGLAGVAGGEVE